METIARILIIDDEHAIRKLLEIALESSHYNVLMAATVGEGKTMIATQQPDLVLLDLGLPDGDGQDLLVRIREWYFKPVIVLSARSEESEIILALDHGANDYLTKPFRSGELLARIRSALRLNDAESTVDPKRSYGNLLIDLSLRTVKRDGEEVKLTSTEYALLSLFIKNEGKVLTHQFILREVWGPAYIGHAEYPRVFVAQLRKKLGNQPNQPSLIRTESGIGYRFTG
ncbi:MAG: response regulator [Saprospiraceae bacterium]|nr:response regulator [Saprospiraceae bacterium]